MLELVNREGGIRPAEAAKLLSLPRPTSHRILETLEELGYVCRSPSDSRFMVTAETARLSAGYNREARLSRVAGPPLSKLLREIVWPVHVSTHVGGKMIIRETTQGRSPFGSNIALLGKKVPVLRTASGRVFFAYSSTDEREALLDAVRAHGDPADLPHLDPQAIDRMVKDVREHGYATRHSNEPVPDSYTIAVPILLDDQIQGSLAVLWPTCALSMDDAVDAFLPRLQEAAMKMGQRETFDANQ